MATLQQMQMPGARNERVFSHAHIRQPQPLHAFQISALLANIASESSAVADRVPGARILRVEDITTLLLRRQFSQERQIEGLEVRVFAPASEFDLAEIDRFTSWSIDFKTRFQGETRTFGFSEMLDFLGRHAPDLNAQQVAGLLKPADFVGERPLDRLARLRREITNINTAFHINDEHLDGATRQSTRERLFRERDGLTSAKVKRLVGIMNLGPALFEQGVQVAVTLDQTQTESGQYVIAIHYLDGRDPFILRTLQLDRYSPLERSLLDQAATAYRQQANVQANGHAPFQK